MKEWNESLLEEVNIDTAALLAAVDEATEHAIFEDAYGNGIALVNNVSYATYHDLAAAFGLDAADFQRPEAETWKVGDTYFQAYGDMNGRNWDIGELAQECRTQEESQANADTWLSGLTDGEQKSASAYVLRYRIIAIDDNGSIGHAESY